MSCPDAKHEWRAVNPLNVPDREGENVEIIGAPPETEEEPAWCRTCGALRCKKPTFGPFGGGWGVQHPVMDFGAPTILNLLRQVGPHAEVDGYRIIVLEDDGRGALAKAVPVQPSASYLVARRRKEEPVTIEVMGSANTHPASVFVALLKVAGVLPRG